MLSEYRERFSEFHTEWQREEFLWRSGERSRDARSRLWSEHSDLFSIARIEELRAAREAISEFRETERRGIDLLIAFAMEGNLRVWEREIVCEIEEDEAAARVDWEGGKIGLAAVEEVLAVESDAGKRNDLFARCAEAAARGDELRHAYWNRRREGTGKLGYGDPVAMHRETRRIDLKALQPEAERILARTESGYVAGLAALLPQEVDRSIDDATEADLPRLRHFPRFDRHLPPERMPEVYRELFAALGFQTGSQANVEVDAATRPAKQLRAFCAPIRVPEEIKLAYCLVGGQANYGEFLHQAGRAQHAAWTSRNLHPEFRRGGDPAVGAAWGLLFESLLLDATWLTATFGFVDSDAFRRALGLFRWMDLRRDAARLLHEIDFHTAGAPPELYRERMTDAVRVRFGFSGHFRDLDPGFSSANRLRARAFESQFREHLKLRFGSRWWASPRAGETLIDLWNTGQRHSIEELARMTGLGDLDFDWLISSPA
ncbi:MAG: hypothetical protein ACKVX9_15155 [Blastocatellia bacterium]